MAISIDYLTKVIHVPKTDTVLIQSAPTEIRELDLNWFRLTLKDLEDDAQGMPFVDTHVHNTTVDVGGVTLARVISIINGYTVTFEDGQYAVNLIGANSNVGDVVNVNQVSVRSANSAGLVTSAAIEYGEYGGGVTIDVVNGEAGTIYPIGTPRRPVNNLADVALILEQRGFPKVFVVGELDIDSQDFSSGVTFEGISKITTVVNLLGGTDVDNCTFKNMTIGGVLDNGNRLVDCLINIIESFDGFIERCGVNGGIIMGGVTQTTIIDSYSNVAGGSTPFLDMGGSGSAFAMRGWTGGLEIQNKTGNDECSMDINSGQIKIAPSVTDNTIGGIIIRGIGKLVNNALYPEIVDHSNYIWAELLLDGVKRATYIGKDGSGICVDPINGTDFVDYPAGTRTHPCKTETNFHDIAHDSGLNLVYVINSINLTGSLTDGYTMYGDNPTTVNINCDPTSDVSNLQFRDCYLTGELNTFNIVRESVVGSITNANGFIYECGILGPIVVSDNLSIQNCFIAPTALNKTVVIDFNNQMKSVIVSDWASGKIQVKNMVTGSYFAMSGTGGQLILDSNNTGGIIAHAGAIDLDTTNEGLFDVIKDISTAGQVWDMRLSDHTSTGTAGEKLDTLTNSAVSPQDIIDIVNGVWDELLAGHAVVGSAGEALTNSGSGGSVPTKEEIATQVWAELEADNTVIGSLGVKLSSLPEDTITAQDITDLVDAMWDELLTGHQIAGSAGAQLSDIDTTTQLTLSEITDSVWQTALADHSAVVGSVAEKLDSLENATPTDITAIANAVWNLDIEGFNVVGTAGNRLRETGHIRKAIFVDTDSGVNGDGTAGSPFNNINDAKDHAEEMGIKEIVTYSEIVLNTNFKNFVIYGLAAPVVDTNGQDCSGSEFHHCTMRGTYTGNKPIVVQESVLDDQFQLTGFFENCVVVGQVNVIGQAQVKNCSSGIAGLSTPTFNMNTGVATSLSVRDWSGGILVQNMDHVNDVCTLEISQGRAFVDSTNTQGLISVRGVAFFEDTSNGTTVETSALLDPSKSQLTEAEQKQLFKALTTNKFLALK